MKGLRLSIYRAADLGADCTNGGISGKANTVTVVGRLVNGEIVPLPKGVFEPTDEAPAVVLVPSRAPSYDPTPHLIPLEFADGLPAGHVGPMFGGNYAGSCDSRWSDLGKFYGVRLDVVAVHDRIESYGDYLALSR